MNNGVPQNQRKRPCWTTGVNPTLRPSNPLGGGKYPATGVFQQKNNGAIVFKINDGVFNRDQKTNHKEVELNYSDRNALFEGIVEATNNPEFKTKQLVLAKKQFIKSGGMSKISDQAIVQAMFTIIRDDDGVITLVYTKGDYKAPLVFRGSNDSTLWMKNEAGEKVEDRGTMSRWAARGWVKFHETLLNEMEIQAWEPPKPRDPPPGAPKPYNQQPADDGFDNEPDF